MNRREHHLRLARKRGQQLFERGKELGLEMFDCPHDAITDLLHYTTTGNPENRLEQARETVRLALVHFEAEVTGND